jgi:glyoxylase-like metal-dependent hydrolase (beta-lactamase superfamily II)/rhodanese-related sulfurtransferase
MILISCQICFGESLGEELLNKASKNVKSIDTKALLKVLKKNPNIKIIDVRTKSDILKQGGFFKVNKYINIPRDKLEFLISNEVEKNERFVLSCYDGKISLLTANMLKNLGYKNILHYKDGYKKWVSLGNKISSLDRYIDSMLYSKVQKVSSGVYVSIGQTSPGTYENSGHNNNLGFVVGSKYVLVWNSSANYLLAKSLHKEIKKITNKKVKYVLLENSQGHAMLGSKYWKEQGAIIVSHKIARDEIKSKGSAILKKYSTVYKDKILGTTVVIPDEVFVDKMVFDLGAKKVEARYFGYAHEHSDIALWLPKEKILFAGDLAFNNRLLPIFKITKIDKWLKAWDRLSKLKAKVVIPGHGYVTDMKTVTKYTKDYLVYIKDKVTNIIDNDGGLEDVYSIDQSKYEHLDTFRELSKQNLSTLFKQLEFE